MTYKKVLEIPEDHKLVIQLPESFPENHKVLISVSEISYNATATQLDVSKAHLKLVEFLINLS